MRSRHHLPRFRLRAVLFAVTSRGLRSTPAGEWVDGRPGTAELQLGIVGLFKELDEGLDKRLETARRLVSRTVVRRVEDVDFRARIRRTESENVRCSEDGR
jgi:hypothetical protein